jgi:hypothetical protein
MYDLYPEAPELEVTDVEAAQVVRHMIQSKMNSLPPEVEAA